MFDYDDAFNEAMDAADEIVTRDDLANAPDYEKACPDASDGRHQWRWRGEYLSCRACGALVLSDDIIDDDPPYSQPHGL